MGGVNRASCALLVLSTSLCACTPPHPPAPLPARPIERSSVDVLLRHQGELALTDDQVLRLQALDDAREAEVATLRTQLAERRRALENKASGDRPADIGTGNGRQQGGGMGGMAGGSARAMSSSAGAGHSGKAPPLAGKRVDEVSRLRQKIDDADTRAFVDASSQVLTAAQRPEAEKLASSYREALFDWQQASLARGELPPDE
jgi:hypothetical protein